MKKFFSEAVFFTFRSHSASLAGLYDNPIPTRFLTPIDCSKIPAQLMLQACDIILYSWW